MALGLNRQNDTPIGGADEFRGNMDVGTFGIGDAAIFDGEKFVPGTTDATIRAFGGVATTESVGHVADGTSIGPWNSITPIGASPQQVTANTTTGVLTVVQAGIYLTSFTANIASLANNQDYIFSVAINGVPTTFSSVVVGSNNVSSQAVALYVSAAAGAGDTVSIISDSVSKTQVFAIVSGSLEIQRIG